MESIVDKQIPAVTSQKRSRRSVQFTLIVIAATVAAYSRFVVSPLQEAMRQSMGFSDNQMALIQGPALALPMVLGAIPLGLLIDRYSRGVLLMLFATIGAVGSILTGYAASFATLFGMRCLVGLAVTAASTTSFSLLADLYPPASRGRATMVVIIGQYGGMSAAFALGGYLLANSSSNLDGWRHAALLMTLPVIAGMLTTFSLKEPARLGAVVEKPSIRTTYGELWKYRAAILPLMGALIAAEMAILAVMTWAAPVFSRSFGLSPDRIGTIMAVGLMTSGIVGPLAGGFLADICQRTGGPARTTSVLAWLAVLCGPSGCFCLVGDVSLATAALVVFMTVIGAVLVAGIAMFTIVVPNELRGICMSLLAGGQVLFGVGATPLMVSALSGAMGGAASIGSALAVVDVTTCALAALSFWIGRRAHRMELL